MHTNKHLASFLWNPSETTSGVWPSEKVRYFLEELEFANTAVFRCVIALLISFFFQVFILVVKLVSPCYLLRS